MDKMEIREIAYVMIAIGSLLSTLFIMTLVHELGHVVAATLLGGSVEEFNVTLFNGGTIKWKYMIEYPEQWIIVRTIVRLSGGLALSLLFALLGFFKRPFLLIVPLHIIDGIAEVFQMGGLHSSMTRLTVLFIVIVINHALYVKLRGMNNDGGN